MNQPFYWNTNNKIVPCPGMDDPSEHCSGCEECCEDPVLNQYTAVIWAILLVAAAIMLIFDFA